MKSKFIYFLVSIFIVLLDQLTKIYIENSINLFQDFSIINNILSITKVYNTGAAFSLFQQNTSLLTIFSIAASLILIFYIVRLKNNLLQCVSLSLLLGGSIGNLLDRIIKGYVVDFIQLDFINFPVFNIADIFINIGTFLLIIFVVMDIKQTKNEQ